MHSSRESVPRGLPGTPHPCHPPASPCSCQAPLLGTLSVWWAMAALGFFIMVLPFETVVGFRGGMARPAGAAVALILAFLPFKVATLGRVIAVGWAAGGRQVADGGWQQDVRCIKCCLATPDGLVNALCRG